MKEEKLRVGQANEALEALRWAVAEKSRIYRMNPLLASGKKGKTRGWDAIKEVEKELRFLMKKYMVAKRSLQALGVAAKYPQFQALTRTHLRGVTAVYNPNKADERNKGLSWIWNMNVAGDSDNSQYLEDGESDQSLNVKPLESHHCDLAVYRASWIRARSRYDRWKEELLLVEAEMDWYVRFMEYRQNWAMQWTELGLGGGYDAYAFQQADMWRRLAQRARKQFLDKTGVDIPSHGSEAHASLKSEEGDPTSEVSRLKSEEGTDTLTLMKSEEGVTKFEVGTDRVDSGSDGGVQKLEDMGRRMSIGTTVKKEEGIDLMDIDFGM